MPYPDQEDYIQLLRQLLEEFEQNQDTKNKRGRPFTHENAALLVFFSLMTIKRVFTFKAMRRWLEHHKSQATEVGFESLPSRRTLSRRYKALYEVVKSFVEFVGQWAAPLGEAFATEVVYEDKSLFKACGAVWHKKDQKANRIPKGVRLLDQDATWSKSAYHGWVFGYSLHTTSGESGFPLLVCATTAKASEHTVLGDKQEGLLGRNIGWLIGDDGYTNFGRTEEWAKRGVVLVTPALRATSEKGKRYRRFINQPWVSRLLKQRKTAIEPIFDLVGRLLLTTSNHKQLPIRGLGNVRSFLSLGVMLTQLAMLINSIWGLPLRNISHLLTVCL